MFKFLPKNGKKKKKPEFACFFALSQVRTFAKTKSQEPNPKQRNKKLKEHQEGFLWTWNQNFCKKVLHQLVTTLAYQKKLGFSCSRSSSILRGALLKKSLNKQGSRKKSFALCELFYKTESGFKKARVWSKEELDEKGRLKLKKDIDWEGRISSKEEVIKTWRQLKEELDGKQRDFLKNIFCLNEHKFSKI